MPTLLLFSLGFGVSVSGILWIIDAVLAHRSGAKRAARMFISPKEK